MEYIATCISNKGYEKELTVGKIYKDFCSNEDDWRSDHWITTINDLGDDESYPSELFIRQW